MTATATFIRDLQGAAHYERQIVHREHLPARAPKPGDLRRPLPPALERALARRGISRLYSHQAQAIEAVRAGENVVVATSTASGKTLCYNLPVLEALVAKPNARALYLFPTKALAQDQLRNLRALAQDSFPSLYAATFDGDTPLSERNAIKRRAQIVLSNPDMLHLGVLPNHASWAGFLRSLRYVVVDELHAYRGVFGSHVADVLRRLRRVCAIHGCHPQFIGCSATIANPGEHAARLLGLPVTVVDDDGAPRGAKEFVFWNPPLEDDGANTRRSANGEAAAIFATLVRRGIRNITFVKTRRLAELVYMYARDTLRPQHPELAARIRSYRAGYLPEDRREIERALFDGSLLGVTATNALELGVDIGDLDATVITGYPGSVASTWQQAGRSGRGLTDSLTILIAMDNPLDQYLMRHPEAFFGQRIEHALIAPENRYILRGHLLCAAYESPLSDRDADLFGPAWEDVRQELEVGGHLRRRGGLWHLSAQAPYPAQEVSIRSSSVDQYLLVEDGPGRRELETVEAATAFFQIHPGAVYLHQGETYVVRDLDLNTHIARATRSDVDYYTQALEQEDLQIVEVQQERSIGTARACLGRVQVRTQVVGYQKKRQYGDDVIGTEDLSLPPQTFDTVALWFDVPGTLLAALAAEGLDPAGGLHAAEHALIGLLPLFAMCDRRDIGGLSTPYFPQTRRAEVFIYDAHPGGVGISEKGFLLLQDLWHTTAQALAECPCAEGCPSCVHSPKCGNNNEPLDKRAAQRILRTLSGQQEQEVGR